VPTQPHPHPPVGHDALRRRDGVPDHRRIHPDHPLTRPAVQVRPHTQPIQHLDPGAVGRPPTVTVVHRLPVAVDRRKVPPGTAGAGAPHHPVDHHPVVHPLATTTGCPIWQQGLQQRPLHIRQVMSLKHPVDLRQRRSNIRGTRPSTHPGRLRRSSIGCHSCHLG
jgi:hypothetical protein